jgi:hypothetical protein
MARKNMKPAQPSGGSAADGKTTDGFANFAAKLGMGTDNLISQGKYVLSELITRNRTELEACYRSSWIIGKAVDVVAEDMTREGVTILSEHTPDDGTKMQKALGQMGFWKSINESLKWARLFGGSVAVMLIDGHDFSQPVDPSKIRKGAFKGLYVLDRWRINPSFNDMVTEYGPEFRMPKYYEVIGDNDFPSVRVHHSRVLRFDGIELPYYQKVAENRWGLSIVERMWDRLIAYDSITHGTAQLVFIAYLRKIGVKGLREALSIGGKTEENMIKQFNYIRLMQSNMGITLLDEQDNFETQSYTFSGLSDVMDRAGEQIAGATDIPLVRFFGMTPAGFNGGDTDLRNYYDRIHKDRENQLRPLLMSKVLPVLCQSVLNKEMPDDFDISFPSLWQLTDKEKAEITTADETSVSSAFTSGLISKSIALKELKQQSRITGRFTNITNEDITEAENEPDRDMTDLMSGLQGFGPGKNSGEKGKEKPAAVEAPD